MARVGGGQWVAGLSGCVAMVALAYHPTAIRASSVAHKSRPTADTKVQRAILSPVYMYTPTGACRPGAGAGGTDECCTPTAPHDATCAARRLVPSAIRSFWDQIPVNLHKLIRRKLWLSALTNLRIA